MGHNSPEALHALIEAKRIAFADRAAYDGDPAAVPASVLKTLISKTTRRCAARRSTPIALPNLYKVGAMPGVTPSAPIAEALQNFTGLDLVATPMT